MCGINNASVPPQINKPKTTTPTTKRFGAFFIASVELNGNSPAAALKGGIPMAAKFSNPTTGVMTTNLNLNEDGYLAQSGDATAGTKSINIPGIKVDAEYPDVDKALGAIVGIAGGSFDSVGSYMTVKRYVTE